MFAPRQIAALVVLSFAAAVLAALALTQDWRPALAVGLLQAILLRIGLAVEAGATRPRPARVRAGTYPGFGNSAAA